MKDIRQQEALLKQVEALSIQVRIQTEIITKLVEIITKLVEAHERHDRISQLDSFRLLRDVQQAGGEVR
jgi:hypothetical protein